MLQTRYQPGDIVYCTNGMYEEHELVVVRAVKFSKTTQYYLQIDGKGHIWRSAGTIRKAKNQKIPKTETIMKILE